MPIKIATKKRSKPKDAAKHRAILRAATQLFLRQGFSHTSMEEIAEHAGVTKQTVYSHYRSKDDLFQHMITELGKKHAPSEILMRDPGQPIAKRLHTIGMGLLTMLTSKDGLAATRLVIAEIHHHPGLARQYYEGGTQRMVEILADFLDQQPALQIKDPAAAAACFFSMLKGRYYVRMLLNVSPTPDPREKEKHVRETVKNFLILYGKK